MRDTSSRRIAAFLLVGICILASGCGQPQETAVPKARKSPDAATSKAPEEGDLPKTSGVPEIRDVSDTQAPAGEITILCGTSFGPPMEKLVKMYEEATGNKTLLAYGGSEDHLPKVKLKAVGDVFVSHTPYMQYTRDADAMLREEIVGHMVPVLVVQKGNPKKLEKIEDLAQPGLRVVLSNPEFSTCGKMVAEMLEKKGIKEAVMKNVGNDLVKHHATIGNQLKLDARDAGMMWNGVVHNYLDAIEIVPTPHEPFRDTQVGIMGLSYTDKKEAVEQFLDFVNEHGKEVFTEFGYVK